ncbi:lamin tail domain-containing protein [Hyalangium versicolor]|uniref:lamin tail domain-containing protein n=1 Tax=Hyalangium versicolor TaxID=2861190 RepID=UPI001CC94376|nr:lamin tail domain-containing protein [Hyalangium versicolor]
MHVRSLLPLLILAVAAPAWSQTGPKVLFDSLHAQTAGNADWVLDEDTCGTAQRYPTPSSSGITASTPETYWGGAYSAFGVDLVKKNFQVESLPKGGRISYGDSTNAQDLSNYKVFILPEPNVLLTATEKSAIIAFVRNGGGLFLIVDHAGSDRNNDGKDSTVVGNDLMASTTWGIHLQTGTEANNWFDDAPNSNFTTDTSSPIIYTGPYGSATRGKGLGLFGSTSMTLNPSQNATVKGHVWMTTATAGSNSQVTFATSTDGTGRIAVIGDSSPSEDATNGCGHTTYDGWTSSLYDDARIHLNAVAWLAAGGGGGGGGDTTPPSAPSNLSATAVSSSQINLSWTASTDNVGVVDYDVFRSTDGSNFSVVASTTSTSHSDTALAASTTSWYQVKANDAANNASAASNTASATTSAAGSPAKVILNELLANEPGSDTTGEFVELVNAGGTSISIAGWTITVGTTLRHTFASGTTLAAGKAIVVYAGASAIPAGLTNAVAASTGSLVLGNSGATVIVKNGSTTIDSLTYSSSLSGTDGVSMNRSPDASATGTFVLHTTLSTLSSSGGKRVNGTAF